MSINLLPESPLIALTHKNQQRYEKNITRRQCFIVS